MKKKTVGAGLFTEAMLEEVAKRALVRPDFQERREAARRWIKSYDETDVVNTKERSLQSSFLHRVFVDILGFRDQGAGGKVWTLDAEPVTEVDARFPDGSFGYFRASGKQVRGVIELKDALTDLDAKQLSRKDRLSPVEQVFLYLVRYEGARYAALSNFRFIRLYSRRFGMTKYQEFDLLELADADHLATFLGVFSEEMLLGSEDGLAMVDRLLAERRIRPQEEITKDFYLAYSQYRDRLVRYLTEAHPRWGADIVEHVQKLLDRVLFILFAQSLGLLPGGLLGKTIDHALRSRARREDRAWTELRYLFEDVDKGRPDFEPSINRYNGGLFAHDEVLDEKLSLPDQLVEDVKRFEEYDFRTEIDVNVLGHVFENSLVDVEVLRREISLDPYDVTKSLASVDRHRKELGIYYTPSWVTEFVVDQTLGRELQGRPPEERFEPTVLDPACGSGAFLSRSLSYFSDYSRSIASAALQEGEAHLFNQATEASASQHLPQIYGIDILAEAVEISKLSLWLKSAVRTRPLADIETVVEGNTLLPRGEQFGNPLIGEMVEAGGFQVIVGNPPWGAKLDEVDEALQFLTGQCDSYELFLERALEDLLAPGGYLGFVIPDRLLRPEGERLRRYLFDNYQVLTILKLGEGVFPGVFRAAVVVVVQKFGTGSTGFYEGLIITKEDREALEEQGSAKLASLMEQRGGAIAYERVKSHPHYNISLAADDDICIVERMEEQAVHWVGDGGIFAYHGRGEELGKDTFLVQCPSCYGWSVNPQSRAARRGGGYETKTCPECAHEFTVEEALATRRLVSSAHDASNVGQVAVFAGEHVNRYFAAPPLGLKLGFAGFDYKREELYRPPKLLIRQTGVGIYATIDTTTARCLQSVYVYSLDPDDEVALEFYLAQLCSRAMLFYFFIRTNQVEWQSYPKLTHSTLHELPLIRPDLSDKEERGRHDEVVQLVRRRMELANREQHSGPSTEALAVDFEVERQVSKIYGLETGQVARISERLRHQQNIRIIRELYPEDQENQLFDE